VATDSARTSRAGGRRGGGNMRLYFGWDPWAASRLREKQTGESLIIEKRAPAVFGTPFFFKMFFLLLFKTLLVFFFILSRYWCRPRAKHMSRE